MLLLFKSSIVNFTFCMTSRNHKYSQHANSSEIYRDKQNKTLVRRKRIMTETWIEIDSLMNITLQPKT